MRVLLVTPFAPFGRHEHAAADTLVPLVEELSKLHELHVFTPDVVGSRNSSGGDAARIWRSVARPSGKLRAATGTRPYWPRHDGPPKATAELVALTRRVRPDVVHCEYLQTAEVLGAVQLPTVLRLHDVSTDVM